MNNRIRQEVNRIEVPKALHERAEIGVRKAVEEIGSEPNLFFRHKFVSVAGAAVLLICLLIGSGFVSPTMADMLSKVPYLKTFFETKPIEMVIEDQIKDEGYNIGGVGQAPYPDKIIVVSVKGTDDYYNDVKNDVKKIAEQTLVDYQYDAFSVVVHKFEPQDIEAEMDPESKRYMKEGDILGKEILKAMDENDYTFLSFGMTHNPIKHQIEVTVPNTEKRIDELKSIVNSVVEKHDFGEFEVKIRQADMELKEKEDRWASEIIPVIHDGLRARKEFHTKGLAYSFHPLPLQIIVKTTIDSEDEHAAEIAAKIEKTVNDFLTSEEMADLVQDEPYKIIVRSKDQKQIN